MIGSNNSNEREAARAKLDALLAKHKKTWNDLPELLSGEGFAQAQEDDQQHYAGPVPPALDLIYGILSRHLYLTEHQFVAVTLSDRALIRI